MIKKVVIIAVYLLPLLLMGLIIEVPDDYNTIQLAIDNSSPGDTIRIDEGTYQENIVISTDSLRIESTYYVTGDEDTIENTIIDGDDQDRCIWIQSDSVSVCGLKLINGQATSGGGILASPLTGNLQNLRIHDCIIYNCASYDPGFGGGICINQFTDQEGSTKEILRTKISSCHCGNNGGGLALVNANGFVITDCEFINNDAFAKGAGALVWKSTSIDFIGCLFARNSLDNYHSEWGAAICYVSPGYPSYLEYLHGNITNCTIANNTAYNIPGIKIGYLDNHNFLQIRNSIILDESGLADTQPDYCNTWTNYGGTNISETDMDEVFVDADNDNYNLPYYSPCIDKGCVHPRFDDEDGSVADMGYAYHEQFEYKWSEISMQGLYTYRFPWKWLSFAKLPVDPDLYDYNYGQNVSASEIRWHWNNTPDSCAWYCMGGGAYPWFYGLDSNSDEYFDHWSSNVNLKSTKGYKIYAPEVGCNVFTRGLKCEPDTDVSTLENYSTWIGYFIESTQSAEDAIPSFVLNDCIKIQTQRWSTSRASPGDPWSIDPGTCYLNFSDMVVLQTRKPRTFTWIDSRDVTEPIIRPYAEHFEWEEKIDYLPIYVEFDQEDVPNEVAVYVNGECQGAEVVEDLKCQICAYILTEEQGQEIEFAFWYEGRSGVERKANYQIHENGYPVSSNTLFTGLPGEFYTISFNHEEESAVIPYSFSCYPNPFNPETTVSFSLETEAEVELEIYNIKGQKIRTLVNETFRPNTYNITWNGDNGSGYKVSSGVYFVKLKINNEVLTNKVILLK